MKTTLLLQNVSVQQYFHINSTDDDGDCGTNQGDRFGLILPYYEVRRMERTISFMTLNRFTERGRLENPEIRRLAKQNNRPLLCDARELTDQQLHDRLKACHVVITPEWLASEIEFRASAEDVALELCATRDFLELPKFSEDWVWFGVVCFWERWFPDQPSMEMLDDLLQLGFDQANDAESRLNAWFAAWNAVRDISERADIENVIEFDLEFRGSYCIFNWVQDYADELIDAISCNPDRATQLISVCESWDSRFADTSQILTENFRQHWAAAYFLTGDATTGDALFRNWLREDPQWGSGWAEWSDMYSIHSRGEFDVVRALDIIQEGLNCPELRDVEFLTQRLEFFVAGFNGSDKARSMLDEYGFVEGAADDSIDEAADSIDEAARSTTYSRFTPIESPVALANLRQLESTRIPRNARCSCGSGKKYKKCCGR
jgi:hypothetical protein